MDMIAGRYALAALIACAAAGTAAWASVDRSPPPGGVYRLKPGLYVATSSRCEAPPNAAILHYDGHGLSGAHSRACHVTILSRKGSTFVVRQSCIAAGAGPAPREEERQTVIVQDALTFSVRTPSGQTSYRYCPSYQLPADLRRFAR